MTELEYICPLAHCVNLTWYAGGLLYFAGKESDRVTLYYTHLGGKPDTNNETAEIAKEYLKRILYCTRTMMSLRFPVRKVKKTA